MKKLLLLLFSFLLLIGCKDDQKNLEKVFDEEMFTCVNPPAFEGMEQLLPKPLPAKDYTYGFIPMKDGSPNPSEVVQQVKDGLAFINTKMKYNFIFVENHLEADLPISTEPGGSWSHLGTHIQHVYFLDKNNPVMNFGWYETNANKRIPGYYWEYDFRVVVHEAAIHLLLGKYHGHNQSVENGGHVYKMEVIAEELGSMEYASQIYFNLPSNHFRDTFNREDLSNYPVKVNWVEDPSKAGFTPFIATEKEWAELREYFGAPEGFEDDDEEVIVAERVCRHAQGDSVIYKKFNMIGVVLEAVYDPKQCRYQIKYTTGYTGIARDQSLRKYTNCN